MYLVFGFGLTAAVFAGVALIVGTVWGWSTVMTDEDIDYKYNKHKTKIRKKYAINRVTEEVLPKKLQTF